MPSSGLAEERRWPVACTYTFLISVREMLLLPLVKVPTTSTWQPGRSIPEKLLVSSTTTVIARANAQSSEAASELPTKSRAISALSTRRILLPAPMLFAALFRYAAHRFGQRGVSFAIRTIFAAAVAFTFSTCRDEPARRVISDTPAHGISKAEEYGADE